MLDPAQLPGGGLDRVEPRVLGWRRGLGWSQGAVPHPSAFMDLPFWLGVPSLQSQLQWDGGAERGGVGNVAWQLGSRVTSCAVGEKDLGFQGQVWLQQPGSSATVGWRAAQSWGFLTPNTVTRSPHALGGSLSLDPAASC